MTQFPRRVYRKVEEAGHFSRRCPPTLGIPGRREDAGVKAPASWCELGGRLQTYSDQACLSALLRS